MGSSPHTRGAPVPRPPFPCLQVIIPAYAGSTPGLSCRVAGLRDHPRIRGEHVASGSRSQPRAGSSPHTRGARASMASVAMGFRIIPAYAGSTSTLTLRPCSRRDHPRIRGEHPLHRRRRQPRSGSSPHTRGAPSRALRSLGRRGIIPAYAGSTNPSPHRKETVWDHPRIRGEHSSLGSGAGVGVGSSPHTRGAPITLQQDQVLDRIIPAYAGSTRTKRRPRRSSPDHPRIRGEHCPVEAYW